MLPALPVPPALVARLSRTPLAILLDIDGTLAPIAPRPDAASVPAATLAVVRQLSSRPETHVAVVTGRSVADARRLVPLAGVGVIGNHGFEILGEDGTLIIAPEALAHRDDLRVAGERLSLLADRYPGVVVEDKAWTMSVHYRLASRAVIAQLTDTISGIARDLGLAVTRGKEVLELRPPIQVNKGTASVHWANGLGALAPAGAAIYIGDDRTDEDAFRALREASPSAVTVRVGDPDPGEKTDAEFGVSSPEEAREFLEALLAIPVRDATTKR